jgi:hypothetical protein
MVPAIRSVIRDLDPSLVVAQVATMEQVRDRSPAGPRFNTVLFAVFAALPALPPAAPPATPCSGDGGSPAVRVRGFGGREPPA